MKTKRLRAGRYLVEEVGVSEGVSKVPVWSVYYADAEGNTKGHAFDSGSTLAEAKTYCWPEPKPQH